MSLSSHLLSFAFLDVFPFQGLETVQTSAWILVVSIPAVTCLSRSCSVCPNICSSLTCSPDVNVGRLHFLHFSQTFSDFLRIKIIVPSSTQMLR